MAQPLTETLPTDEDCERANAAYERAGEFLGFAADEVNRLRGDIWCTEHYLPVADCEDACRRAHHEQVMQAWDVLDQARARYRAEREARWLVIEAFLLASLPGQEG